MFFNFVYTVNTRLKLSENYPSILFKRFLGNIEAEKDKNGETVRLPLCFKFLLKKEQVSKEVKKC